MKHLSILLIFASILLVLVLKSAFTDAAALINEESMIDSSASDENNNAELRSKKDTSVSSTQHLIPSPHRRHHLKFGVLGKRYSYGYLGKRTDVPQLEHDFTEWLHDMRERRAGRPQYGMLG